MFWESSPAPARLPAPPSSCDCTSSLTKKRSASVILISRILTSRILITHIFGNPALRNGALLAAASYNPRYAAGNTVGSHLGTHTRHGSCVAGYRTRTEFHRGRQRIRTRSTLSRPRIALRSAAPLEIGSSARHRPRRSRHAALLGPPGQRNSNRESLRNADRSAARSEGTHVATAASAVRHRLAESETALKCVHAHPRVFRHRRRSQSTRLPPSPRNSQRRRPSSIPWRRLQRHSPASRRTRRNFQRQWLHRPALRSPLPPIQILRTTRPRRRRPRPRRFTQRPRRLKKNDLRPPLPRGPFLWRTPIQHALRRAARLSNRSATAFLSSAPPAQARAAAHPAPPRPAHANPVRSRHTRSFRLDHRDGARSKDDSRKNKVVSGGRRGSRSGIQRKGEAGGATAESSI